MLFSDWDRSGRRDLRVSNDRHYYPADQGEEQLWRIAPGEAPRLYTAADGWVTVQIEGMGIASYDLTGDGYPEVFLTSQGDNKLQTLTAGPAQPTYRDIALKRGVNAAQPFTGGDVRCPRPPGTRSSRTSTTTASWTCSSRRATSSAMPDYAARRTRATCCSASRTGRSSRAPDKAGIVSFDRGRGAALADFNLDGLLDLVEVNYGEPGRGLAQRGRRDATTGRPMGNWLAVRLEQPGAEPRRHRRLDRGPARRRRRSGAS